MIPTRLRVIPVFAWLVTLAALPACAQTDGPFHILLTNDDGIESPHMPNILPSILAKGGVDAMLATPQ